MFMKLEVQKPPGESLEEDKSSITEVTKFKETPQKSFTQEKDNMSISGLLDFSGLHLRA